MIADGYPKPSSILVQSETRARSLRPSYLSTTGMAPCEATVSKSPQRRSSADTSSG